MSRFMNEVAPWQAPLLEAEYYIADTCQEYYIDCESFEILQSPVEEGLLSSFVGFVKTLFQKVIAFLAKIWNYIVKAVKYVINKVATFFKKIFGTKDVKNVEIKSMVATSPGEFKETTFTSTGEMKATFQKAFTTFTQEINQHTQQQIGYMKKLEQRTMKAAKESMGIVDENLIINRTRPTNDFYDRHRAGGIFGTRKPKADHGEMEVDAVFTEPDELTYIQNKNLGIIDIRDNYAVYADTYNVFKRKVVTEIIDWCQNVLNEIGTDPRERIAVSEYCEDIIQAYNKITRNFDTETALKYFEDSFFPDFDQIPDEEERKLAISNFINLRVNWSKTTVKCIEKMLQANRAFLGLTAEQAEEIVELAKYGDYDQVRQIFDQILDSCGRNEQILDFRKFGMGVLCFSDDIFEDFKEGLEQGGHDLRHQRINFGTNHTTHAGFYKQITNVLHVDTLINYVTHYDLIILSHGYGGLYDPETGEAHPSYRDKRWVAERTPLPDGRYPGSDYNGMMDVNNYIRAAINMGFKRILVLNCNVYGFPIDPDIANNKKVVVRINSKSGIF